MRPILMLSFLMPVLGYAQTLTYDGKAIGINAGTMVVTRNMSNSEEQYSYESHSAIDYLLGRIAIDHVTRASYKNGVLQSAYVRNDKNGEVEYYSSTSFDGLEYCTTTEKGKHKCSRKVAKSFARLFFEEPVELSEIFSERLGVFVPIKVIGEHKYRVDMPNGDVYIYHYENGKMVQMDVPSPVGKAHFYLRK